MSTSTHYSCGFLLKKVMPITDSAQLEAAEKGQWPTPQIPREKLASTTPGHIHLIIHTTQRFWDAI